MNDRTTDQITRRSAERGLDGAGSTGSAQVDETLRLATAPPTTHELNGEVAAVALFKAYNPPRPAPVVVRPQRRRRARWIAGLTVGGVLLTGGGVAWATGRLPDAVTPPVLRTTDHTKPAPDPKQTPEPGTRSGSPSGTPDRAPTGTTSGGAVPQPTGTDDPAAEPGTEPTAPGSSGQGPDSGNGPHQGQDGDNGQHKGQDNGQGKGQDKGQHKGQHKGQDKGQDKGQGPSSNNGQGPDGDNGQGKSQGKGQGKGPGEDDGGGNGKGGSTDPLSLLSVLCHTGTEDTAATDGRHQGGNPCLPSHAPSRTTHPR